jgi:hypothetical protein
MQSLSPSLLLDRGSRIVYLSRVVLLLRMTVRLEAV